MQMSVRVRWGNAACQAILVSRSDTRLQVRAMHLPNTHHIYRCQLRRKLPSRTPLTPLPEKKRLGLMFQPCCNGEGCCILAFEMHSHSHTYTRARAHTKTVFVVDAAQFWKCIPFWNVLSACAISVYRIGSCLTMLVSLCLPNISFS